MLVGKQAPCPALLASKCSYAGAGREADTQHMCIQEPCREDVKSQAGCI